jgi:hypothetical protein
VTTTVSACAAVAPISSSDKRGFNLAMSHLKRCAGAREGR